MKPSMLVSIGAAAAGVVLGARAMRAARAISFDGRVVVITGGSRGLGLVIARQLAREGARIALLARDADELRRAAIDIQGHGSMPLTIPCDVGDRAQAQQAIERVAEQFGRLDVLINDAGTIQVGPAEHMTVDDFEAAMRVHFWGPLYLTLAALPHLRRSRPASPRLGRGHAVALRAEAGDRAGRIVNISSIGGRIAVPHMLPYSASKFALTGLSNGLRTELAKDGIRVTTVLPGLMRTGSPYNAWFKGQHRAEFAWFAVMDSLPGLSIDAERAAAQVVTACRYGDPELVITPQARLAIIADAILPSIVARSMALANRLLPGAGTPLGDESRSGWQSPSRWAPSWLTRLSDRASARNNQVPVG
jgi:NAD(P)-dependent dehydrogenase (short-subunit alcohol dehydrogenase family)